MRRKWLKAGALGQSGGQNSRKLVWPWQYAARLGSPHSEPARFTVGKVPTRHMRRVNRLTPKKAVMATYQCARSGGVLVDKQATAVSQTVGTSARG